MVKTRIKEFCEAAKLSVSAFEKSIGVANGYVNSISKSVGVDKICRVLEIYPNINIEWLLTGNGSMYKDGASSPSTSAPSPSSAPSDAMSIISNLVEQNKELLADNRKLREELEAAKEDKGKDKDSNTSIGGFGLCRTGRAG